MGDVGMTENPIGEYRDAARNADEPSLSSLVGSMPGLRAQLAAKRELELREEGFVPVAEVDRLRAELADAQRELDDRGGRIMAAMMLISDWNGPLANQVRAALSAGGGGPTKGDSRE